MTDIEIAQGNVKENIVDVAKRVGLKEKTYYFMELIKQRLIILQISVKRS